MQSKMDRTMEAAPFGLDAEQLAKARAAKDADELADIASKEGFALTPQQVQDCFDRLHAPVGTAEMTDEELEDVAGGGCKEVELPVRCAYCHKTVPRSSVGVHEGRYYCTTNCLFRVKYSDFV